MGACFMPPYFSQTGLLAMRTAGERGLLGPVKAATLLVCSAHRSASAVTRMLTKSSFSSK